MISSEPGSVTMNGYDSLAPLTWGTVDGEPFAHALRAARAECVHWKRNVFNMPSGSVGKSFVCEMVRLLTAFNDGSPWKSIALNALFTLPVLMLQKPGPASKVKDHVACLERRLEAWKIGDIDTLIREGRTLQQLMLTRSTTRCDGMDEDKAQQIRKLY